MRVEEVLNVITAALVRRFVYGVGSAAVLSTGWYWKSMYIAIGMIECTIRRYK